MTEWRDMNLRHLEIFHAIMSSSTMTEAARKLNVSQPAVSTMLKHMESQLGIELFERISGRLHPTPEAEMLFGDVDDIFKQVATVRRLATTLRDARTGMLTIVASPTLAHALLPAAVTLFRDSRPNVTLQIRELPTLQVSERVARREVDLGVVYGLTANSGGTQAVPVGRTRVACVMHPGHPLADLEVIRPADLAGHDVVSYEAHTPIGQLIERCFREAKAKLSVKVEVSISLTACFIADQGSAVALIDHIMPLSGAFPNLAIRRFEPAIEIDLAVLFPSDRPRSRLASQFAEVIAEVTQAGHLSNPPVG
ncbi:MAG: LysR family transcriptional regulator [Azospirillaceae bacterium]